MIHTIQVLEYQPIETAEIPNIPLYMDQVLGFLSDRMASFRSDPTDKIMTKTMVNKLRKSKTCIYSNQKKILHRPY